MKKAAIGIIAIVLIVTVTMAYVWLQQPKPPRIVINEVTLRVEIAKTPADQTRGLSGRDSLAPDHGMLFVFDHEARWGFWMIDMRFALDIIWFNSERRAVFIEENLEPCTPQGCPVYTPPEAVLYVLEVNAGFVRAHHISLNDTFSFVS